MRYVVELYLPRRVHARLGACLARAATAAREMSGPGAPVECLGTVLFPQDETCFLRYEAPSAAAVEEAARRAEIEFDRVLEARELQARGAATTASGERDAQA